MISKLSDLSATKARNARMEQHAVARINTTIQRMFVETADQNYVVARWSYLNGFVIDFYWLGAHAVEKYLKAILLFNGRSVRRYSHNLKELFAEACRLVPSIDLKMLQAPPTLRGVTFITGETMRAFVERLGREGNPNNRYMTYGYQLRGDEITKLDQVVWQFRRHCRPLKQKVGKGSEQTEIDWANVLANSAEAYQVAGILENLEKQSDNSEAQNAFLRQNFSFNKNFAGKVTWRSSYSNSPFESIFDLVGSLSGDSHLPGQRVIEWMLANVYLSKEDEKDLRRRLAKSKDAKATNSRRHRPRRTTIFFRR